MVMATMFACTSPEKKAEASTSDPDTGTFSSQNEKSQKVREALEDYMKNDSTKIYEIYVDTVKIYDQMAAPKWVIAMGACASSGGMFNNYAIVQGVDHVVPVDIYLPGCPPRPEMLMDAILKLHDQIYDEKLGPNREKVIKEVEAAAMAALPTHQLKGLLA